MNEVPPDVRELTEAELVELGRDVQLVDPSTVPADAAERVAIYNRRVLLLEALLRRARLTLQAGKRIEPELAATVRFSAATVRASRVRLTRVLARVDP